MIEPASVPAAVTTLLLSFPAEWIKAALVVALLGVWVVIVLFAYLNHFTRKPYFSLWTVAWMFYSVHLAASIGLLDQPNTELLVLTRCACIGISALFMFWGSFQLTGHERRQRELGLAIVMMIAWSYLAAYKVQDRLWITLPVFVLLATAGAYAGTMYIRTRRGSRGVLVFGLGLILWSLNLLVFPFAESSPHLLVGQHLVSSLLAMMITVGMVVEQEANISEQNYRRLFDSAGDAIFLLEPATLRIFEVNSAAGRLSGQALVGRHLTELFPDLATVAGETKLLEVVNQPSTELHLALADGGRVVCEGRASVAECPRGRVLQLNVRDITERKKAEEALRETAQQLTTALAELRQMQDKVVQQERLNALSQMASGIGHDFNNALAKILGFVEILLGQAGNLGDRERTQKFLLMVRATAQDAVGIVDRLREFYRSRKPTDVYAAVDLHETIDQAVTLTRPKWHEQALANGCHIQIHTELNQNTPRVRGQPGDLRDVLINLICNAVDAMPEGGTITIATHGNVHDVELIVRDTGTGMTDEVRQRCFEPFFSTNEKRGTGLGLAIVYGIIERHGGTIRVESAPIAGTTFTIQLPINVAISVPTPATASETLRVLIVEDDPQFLDIERQYLEDATCTVETAADGAEAWRKFCAGQFDVVVTDRAMPRMNGDQLSQAIKTVAPNLPVIMVTGFDLPAGHVPVDAVLAKPVTQATLRQTIARCRSTPPVERIAA